MTVKINADTSDGLKFVSDTSGTVDIQSNGTTKMQVTSSAIVGKQNIILDAGTNFCIGASDDVVIGRATDNRMTFNTNGTERGRIDENGDLMIGTVDNEPWNNGSGNSGFAVKANGRVAMAAPDTTPLFVNRVTSDGRLVDFLQDGSTEGEITVSGSTVSYNGGHLARWGRLPSGEVDNTILKGTVMSNLDKMIVWSYDDVFYTKDDSLPEGKSVGDVKVPAYTAENEQRNEIKVSDVEGDINVAGLFVAWRNESDNYNDIGLAMTGDMVIRIAQGTTVQRGDLLMSAGDGTAKPQGDDIVRSKTVAKVISTTVIKTYDDNSYLVPCVVMAC